MKKKKDGLFRRILKKLRRRNGATITGCRPKQQPVRY